MGNYVAVLRGLSRLCEFGNLKDSLIRDQIVRCTNNHRIQEKLLIRNPNLQEAMEIAKGIELTDLCMKEMRTSDRDLVSEVKSEGSGEEVMKTNLSTPSRIQGKQERNRLKCFRCGSSNHLAKC